MNGGSRYIQQQLDNEMDYWQYDASRQCKILESFYYAICDFAQVLCISKHGHYVIDKFLGLCQDCEMTNVLTQFVRDIICKNLNQLMIHSYPCRIIQNIFDCRNNTQLRVNALDCLLDTLLHWNDGIMNTNNSNNSNINNDPNKPNITINNNNNGGDLGNSTNENNNNPNNNNHNNNSNGRNGMNLTIIDRIMIDGIGNYIIQAIIEQSCFLQLQPSVLFLIEYIANNLRELSTNQYGCRVVQCAIANDIYNKHLIFNELFKYLPQLCNDEYGNYSIQKCIEHSDPKIQTFFIENIFFGINQQIPIYCIKQGRFTMPGVLQSRYQNYITQQNPNTIINFSKFAFGKYSSNVCDKAFQFATEQQKFRLINYLCNQNIPINYNVTFGLINHEYANFVTKNMIIHLISLAKKQNQKNLETENFNNHNHNNNRFNNNRNNGANGNNNNNNNNGNSKNNTNNYQIMIDKMFNYLEKIYELLEKYHWSKKFSFAKNILVMMQQYKQFNLNSNFVSNLTNIGNVVTVTRVTNVTPNATCTRVSNIGNMVNNVTHVTNITNGTNIVNVNVSNFRNHSTLRNINNNNNNNSHMNNNVHHTNATNVSTVSNAANLSNVGHMTALRNMASMGTGNQ